MNMPLLQTYLQPWKKYATLQGRTSRREYIVFSLVNCALILLVGICGSLAVIASSFYDTFYAYMTAILFYAAALLFLLAAIIPSIAISVRRLHDWGRSGWLCLIGLIPWAGWLIALILCLQKGDPEANAYGEPPQ